MKTIEKKFRCISKALQTVAFGLTMLIVGGCATDSQDLRASSLYGNPDIQKASGISGSAVSSFNDPVLSEKDLPPVTSSEHERLGDSLLRRGKFHIAYLEYEKALELEPDSILILTEF